MSDPFPIAFGKYMLTELIAVGGMAEVYRAKIFGAEGFEKDMVVKRILPKFAKNPNFVQMLIDEAKIAVSLTHGNIVPIYELGELEGDYYIAMEYVAGRTVLDVLRECHGKRRALPWPHALGIAAEVARGLAYAHTQKGADGKDLGLIHRDINPRNIVISPSGEVKILDFGIAVASTKKTQTKSGVIKGTPGYMSPEQAAGRAIDARSDIFCLGVLLHELLTLDRLFPVWTVAEMRDAFEKGVPAPPSSAGVVSNAGVDDVVMRALAFDPATRFQSAAAFEEGLRSVMASSGQAVTAFGLAREIDRVTIEPPQTSPKPSTSPGVQPSTQVMGSQGARANPGPLTAPMTVDARPKPASDPVDVRPATQSMSNANAEAPFIISLVDRPPPAQLAPLPKTRTDTVEVMKRKTQVLARNEGVGWNKQIGEDAELLALSKAMGTAPSSKRRPLFVAAGLMLVVGLLVALVYGGEIGDLVSRALSGTKVRNGALIAKTVPSGAEVYLDGKRIGVTNMKITGVDPDKAHELKVTPKEPPGIEPIVLELQPSDFKMNEGLPSYVFERNFAKPDE